MSGLDGGLEELEVAVAGVAVCTVKFSGPQVESDGRQIRIRELSGLV